MNIGFIGAGKVGCSLGRYFAENGRDYSLFVKGYYSRSNISAKEAANFTDSVVYESIKALTDDCDVIFLTVPDGSIQTIWQQIRDYDIKGKSICHCSGAMSSEDAFNGIGETGAFGYSVHPLFAVSDKYNAYRELTGVFFTIEGCRKQDESPEIKNLISVLHAMGNSTHMIDGNCKTVYHCAAAMASNLVCGLIDQSIELMERCGFSQKEAIKALAPILTGNMAHIAERGPADSLTGPIERNDTETVRKHLECLHNDDENDIYRSLSRRLVEIAQRRHPDRDYSEMAELLRKEIEK